MVPASQTPPHIQRRPPVPELVVVARRSEELFVHDSGGFSALKNGPVPKGFEYKSVKPWYAQMEDYIGLQPKWVEDCNRTFNYRQ